MTLHEAIELVLLESGSPMTSQEIVSIINERDLYRKESGEEVSTSQVSARVNNYPNLFGKIGNEIFLVDKSRASLNNLLYHIADQLRSKSIYNPDLVIAFLLFYFRLSHLQIGLSYFGNNRFEDLKSYRGDSFQKIHWKINDAVHILTQHPDFRNFKDELQLTFKTLNENTLYQIIRDLKLFDFSPSSISHEEFGQAFNNFLNSFSGWGRDNGESSTPDLISKYISSLIKIRPDQTMCDPFAGNAGIACEVLNGHEGNGCVLQDINPVSVILGKMNLMMHGIQNVEYHQGNSIDLYPGRLESEKFDFVVTHPPFGIRYRQEDVFKLPVYFLPSTSRSENVHIQLVAHLLNSTGQAIIIISDSFLFTNDPGSKEVKRLLLNNDWIEAIHSLPSGSFKPYSAINTSLLILNKNKEYSQKGKIVFKKVKEKEIRVTHDSDYNEDPDIDTVETDGDSSVIVDIQEVFDNELLLNANRYLYKMDFGPEYRTIETLLSGYTPGVAVNKKHLDSKGGIPYITIRDLADSEIDFVLSVEDISTYIGNMSLVKKNYIVWDGAILIAKVGNKLKPTLFSGRSSAFSSNVIALYSDERIISKEYLISQLNQPYFSQQLDQIRGGSARAFLQLKDFLQLKVRVPKLEEQEKELLKIYRARELNQRSSKSEREELEETTQRVLISAIKHEFSNLQVVLSGGLTSFKLFLDKKVSEGVVAWSDKIVDIDNARSIEQVLMQQESLLREMGGLFEDVQSVLNLKKSNINKERIELKTFIKEQVNQMNTHLPDVKVFYEILDRQKKERFVINVDKNLFAKVIKNFLINSTKHGFDKTSAEERIILFDFSLSEDELWIEIAMMNNGKKLTEGFSFDDFISFGGKTGAQSGAGIGGYLMNRIISYHEGTLELFYYPDGTVLYITSNIIGGENEITVLQSKAFIPGVVFKIRLPYKN